jgi:hypothetical protein
VQHRHNRTCPLSPTQWSLRWDGALAYHVASRRAPISLLNNCCWVGLGTLMHRTFQNFANTTGRLAVRWSK